MLLLKNGKIKVIVEIEESDVKPTQICGKLLTSALSNFYIYESNANQSIGMADSILFIQIVDTSKTFRTEAKRSQWKTLEKSINHILPIKGSKITMYRLLTTDELNELENIIERA